MIVSFIRGPMIAVAFGLILGPAGVSAEQECSVPERFYTYEPPLKKTPKALAGSRPLVIATLGGASSVGVAAGGTELAWPARLGSALTERFPSARTRIVNLAVARQTAKRAAERLDRDVWRPGRTAAIMSPSRATLIGSELTTMPSGRIASLTALATAAGAPR